MIACVVEVTRQGDEDSASYELVGECFVHGFMDGEGMKAGMVQSFTQISIGDWRRASRWLRMSEEEAFFATVRAVAKSLELRRTNKPQN
jgi:hypothetical protein